MNVHPNGEPPRADAATTAAAATVPPRRPPGPIRVWGALIALASALPLYFAAVMPYLSAQAGERITLLGLKPFLLAALLLMYGLPMLFAGSGFTRLRDRLPRLGKASALDMVILVVSMLIAYLAEHQLRVTLNAMGYPVPTGW
jgi:hypothetical protein